MTDAGHASRSRFTQFSLRAVLVVLTFFAVSAWWWWQKPFHVESTITKWKRDPSLVGRRSKVRAGQLRKVESKKRQGFTDAVLHGPTRIFDEEGDVISEEQWRRGVRHGLYRKWDEETGELLVDIEFQHGRVVRVGENEMTESIFAITTDELNGQRMKRALEGDTAFDYLDQPLIDVIEDISFNHNIPIRLDDRALAAAGIGRDTPITSELRGVPLSLAMIVIVAPLKLACAYKYELLWITTLDSELHDRDRPPRLDTESASPQILNALEGETEFDYMLVPLADVLDDIAFRHNIPIEKNVSSSSSKREITTNLKGLSLRASFAMLLYDCDLRCEAQGDALVIMDGNEDSTESEQGQ